MNEDNRRLDEINENVSNMGKTIILHLVGKIIVLIVISYFAFTFTYNLIQTPNAETFNQLLIVFGILCLYLFLVRKYILPIHIAYRKKLDEYESEIQQIKNKYSQ